MPVPELDPDRSYELPPTLAGHLREIAAALDVLTGPAGAGAAVRTAAQLLDDALTLIAEEAFDHTPDGPWRAVTDPTLADLFGRARWLDTLAELELPAPLAVVEDTANG